jgi:hypothetical protein
VTTKNAVFWDVASCRYFVNRRFGGTYRLHLQSVRNPRAMTQREQIASHAGSSLVDSSSDTYDRAFQSSAGNRTHAHQVYDRVLSNSWKVLSLEVKIFSYAMEPGSSQYSQKPASVPYPKPLNFILCLCRVRIFFLSFLTPTSLHMGSSFQVS